MTKEGGEVTMNRFRKWLYKPKVSYRGFTRCVSSAVSHFLCIAVEIASEAADQLWLVHCHTSANVSPCS